MSRLFILFLIAAGAAVGEYFYFGYRLDTQRRTIIVLTKQNEKLRSKANKQQNSGFSTVNISYAPPPYRNGYTTENCYIFLSPLENSPIVYQCAKAIKASIIDSAEVLNTKWYMVSIASNNNISTKGWMKESDVKFVVDEATSN